MNGLNAIDRTAEPPVYDKRQVEAGLLYLVQLDPELIIDCTRIDAGYLTDEIMMAGKMRETCPECKTTHLDLVLRQKRVRKAHMFCGRCTRCFDACYPDGSSALSIV